MSLALRSNITEEAREGQSLNPPPAASNDPWENARQNVARLINADPKLADLLSQPLDEEEPADEFLDRVNIGEFAEESYAAFYGESETEPRQP